MDLCSKCYRDLRIKEEQAVSIKTALEKLVGDFVLIKTRVASSPPSAVESAGAVKGQSIGVRFVLDLDGFILLGGGSGLQWEISGRKKLLVDINTRIEFRQKVKEKRKSKRKSQTLSSSYAMIPQWLIAFHEFSD
ncbi:hypothetical protein RHSIM_Rhsim07G0099700 [Rhododendron simsii]|uniref:Uncharacterized protein n=1 Tax=Rhododendron simsii TaxID=118357 RepID=A0A834GTX7_RHOSS|nr:hypothetical protein RHSIM_Rhsim07G0099700 [Rhododendron simsii]